MEEAKPTRTNPLNLDLYCVETTMEEEEDQAVFQPEEAFLPMQVQHEEKMLLFWEDDELVLLSNKEKQTFFCTNSSPPVYQSTHHPFLFSARTEGVRWLMLASAHLGFTAQTTLLAVHYFDRFMSSEGRKVSESQPWLIQLCSVTCLSIAAKLEETHVPLLLDLQLEDTRFVFEAKTLQRMELLVLSTLDWKMNPITPLSFVDHMVRRMASSENHENKPQHWKFQKMCHSTLLSVIADSRWLEYLPSVLAAATMLHVLDQMEECGNQIISLLNTKQEEVDRCYQFILETISMSDDAPNASASNKRKYPCYHPPSSPDGIIGTSVFSFDSSNDSWCSSPQHPLFKRPNTRADGEQQSKSP